MNNKRDLSKMDYVSHMSCHTNVVSDLSAVLKNIKNVKVCHHENNDKVHKFPKVVIPHVHHLCSSLSPHKSPHSYAEIKHFFPSY